LKKEREILQETKQMLPNAIGRLANAIQDYESFLADNFLNDFAGGFQSEELIQANSIYNDAKSFLN
jgi:hypothetical protein